jgi:hypothetical protein
MAFWEAIVFIVAIGAIASVLRARYGITSEGRTRDDMQRADPDAERLRAEVTQLKDRIAVLERLATDNNRALDLDREIDRLR